MIMFLIGLVTTCVIVYFIMPANMILKRKSPLSFDETINQISKNIKEEGWSLMGIRRIDESIKKHGQKTDMKVALIELCHSDYANAIISDKSFVHISVMMPCTISVYENKKGDVYISNMNTAMMGWVFGGIVRKIMAGKVAPAQKKFLNLRY